MACPVFTGQFSVWSAPATRRCPALRAYQPRPPVAAFGVFASPLCSAETGEADARSRLAGPTRIPDLARSALRSVATSVWQAALDSRSFSSLPTWRSSSLVAATPSLSNRARHAGDCMTLLGGRQPGVQRTVAHRELSIIRRISREDPQDRAHDSSIEG